MLIIYRRHKKDCKHRSEGRAYRRCRCPIWIDGTAGGVEVRKSLGLVDWQRAQDVVRQWEADNRQPRGAEPITIAEAWQRFLADAGARKLSEATIYKYTLLKRQLVAFADERGLL